MNHFAKNFLSFIDSSPTPFHVCKSAASILEEAGFKRLHEDTPWKAALQKGTLASLYALSGRQTNKVL